MSGKIDNVELRVVLIGEVGVGKKTMVKRFKILNCTETKDFYQKKNKNANEQKSNNKEDNEAINKNKENNINANSNSNTITDKSKKKNEMTEMLKEEIEKKKYKCGKKKKEPN